ncbi:PDR/VanB family oxidoreductase [Mycobacteroides abscessus]|uniref:PDR/VanB family oxidoreductase n=1 Tax=Mycobacteroides abscessus TaxID=36809 RepID=UPI000D3ECA9D|nr:PDR/VanB family oxidoreductase [Mycobacteroides abscessus]PVB25947.1 oxidoreductase [Mycobacteroides abscessus]
MFAKYRDLAVPGHAYGKYRRDPLMLLMTLGYDALAWVDKFTTVPQIPDSADGFIDVVVEGGRALSADGTVLSLAFTRPDGASLPAWSAGAHIDVKLPSGLMRQYSLCGDPADLSQYRIAVRRVTDSRGGSTEIHNGLRAGAELRISLPRNAFPLAVGGYNQRTTEIRLIAGGIGITPILPMLRVLDQVAIPWSFIYTGRDRNSMAFLDELERYGDRVTVYCDDDATGPPTPQALLGELAVGAAVYTCGPPPMIAALRTVLADRRDVEFHYERFSAAPVVDGQEFEIELSSTSEVITVAADQTALAAILDIRPDATYSCQQGFCRSCVVRVLDGVPEHRSTSLSPSEVEAGYFLPCVSRAHGRLSLDM